MIEPLLLTAARICTFERQRSLTNASGFFFERDGRLFLVTSRHVLIDAPSEHFPDRIEIELHVDAANLAQSVWFSIPLYRDGRALWRQCREATGEVDAAAIEVERAALPATVVLRAFTPAHLDYDFDQVEVGTPVLMVGFPLGFHDTLHHMPVVMRVPGPAADDLPWRLLGIHSSRFDMESRDTEQDEALGLNCVWYADILRALTDG